MENTVALATSRPDQQKNILSCWNRVYRINGLFRRVDVLTVDLHNDISWLETSVFGGAAGTNAGDGSTLDVVRQVELLTDVRCDIGHCEAELALLRCTTVSVVAVIAGNLILGVILTDR